jgi:hypothetical protein
MAQSDMNGDSIEAGPSPSFARRVAEAGLPAHTLAQIAQRRGKATAVVALARKLAGIMFAVWRDGTEFDPQLLRPRGEPASPGSA